MIHTELFSVLRTFTPQEFKQLGRIVRSKPHGGNQKNQVLYQILRSYYPAFELSPTDIRKVYKRLYPRKDFNENALRRTFNSLLNCTENLLLQAELDDDSYLYRKQLIDVARRAGLFKLFEQTLTKLHAELDGRQIKDSFYRREKTELYERLYAHIEHNKYDYTDSTLEELIDANHQLTLHYKALCTEYQDRISQQKDVLSEKANKSASCQL